MDATKRFKIILVLVLLALVLAPALNMIIAAGVAGREALLKSDSQPYELFRDEQGQLWISDYWLGEIWRVNPDTGAYTIFSQLYGASDGRIDAEGKLWWTDLDEGRIGRLTPGESQATLWSLGEDAIPLGLAFGNSGQIWISDIVYSRLYRFTAATTELCTYPLPDNGTSDYLLFADDLVWLGDPTLGRLYRFNPADAMFTIWELPPGAYPQRLAMDDDDLLWWADNGLGAIGSLNPANSESTIYEVPGTSDQAHKPVSIALENGYVYYTDQSGYVGSLDPAVASGRTSTLHPKTKSGVPSCSTTAAGQSAPVSQTNGQLEWSNVAYTVAIDGNGWQVFELPEDAAPWGIAAAGSNIWFNDQGLPGSKEPVLGWIDLDAEAPDSKTNYLPVVIGN